MLLRKITRPMLASAFIAAGVEALRAPSAQTRTAQPLVDGARSALPASAAAVVPAEAATVIKINGAAQIGAGLLLATGRAPRIASAALAGTLVPTTMYETAFWAEPDPQLKALKRSAFVKNVGLLGGVLISAADTEGKPSLAWRGRQQAASLRNSVAAALPFGAAAGGSALQQFAERAQHDAAEFGERTGVAAEAARERAAELAEAVADRAPVVAEHTRERAGEFAHFVADRAPVVAEQARDRAAGLAGAVAERAPEVADQARTARAEARKASRLARREAGKLARHEAEKVRTRVEKRR